MAGFAVAGFAVAGFAAPGFAVAGFAAIIEFWWLAEIVQQQFLDDRRS